MPDTAAAPADLVRYVEELTARHRGVVSREEVEALLHDSYQRLERAATVRTYLPVLARRFAAERLAALGRQRGQVRTGVPSVLFVCVHNAGRSQLAAALLDHHALGRVDVRSAGSQPASQLNPAVVEALAEVGIHLDQAYPKPVTDEVVRAADVVVTMGCGDACPVFPGTRYVDWPVPDPEGLDVEAVRPILRDVDRRVRALLEELA